ncbi:BTAD domain-containing putative transcriptional regulator [Micromonospora sp. NPDC007230]|uniref:AfsR/SARP family transcriptional regulator n=1 Tax=Micromonospora sp. NPDC007230 TaxID=3364237 RepID=UPI00369CDB61
MALFHVLGPLEVHSRPGQQLGAGKPATLLAALLVQPNAWVAVDHLLECTWQEQAAPSSAEANLKTYVWRLRRLLPDHDGGPRIDSRRGAYRLRVGPGELDAHQAAELAAQARVTATNGDSARALALVEQALGLWRGRPFAGFDAATSADVVDRLDELHLDLRECQAKLQLALGRAEAAIGTLRTVTTTDPLREGAWAHLVRALHVTGARAAALAAYRQAGEVLATELGVEPGPALTEAYRRAGGAARPGRTRRELPRDVPLIGRADELAAVRRAAGGSAPVVLVDGMVGVGKTAFAVHAAHRLAARYPDGQFFVRLPLTPRPSGSAKLVDVLGRLLRGIGVRGTDLPGDLDERSALWRSELAGRRVLLVLDDVPDAAHLAPLLPSGAGCLTVVTTRNRGWHPDDAARITLRPLGEEEATALFRAAAGGRATGLQRTAVAAVVRRCGGLPAALRDAAARLRTRPHWTIRTLVEELDDEPCQVLSDVMRRSVTTARDGLSGHELAAWYALSELPDEFGCGAAARVIGATVDAARSALEVLVDRGLLEFVSADRYRSHVLIRRLARCTGRVREPHGVGRRVA